MFLIRNSGYAFFFPAHNQVAIPVSHHVKLDFISLFAVENKFPVFGSPM
jgi:hypothetical protein